MKESAALQIFIRVAELSSFTAAADSLNIPKSSVSASIQQLENLLQTRLLHRTTRRVNLTQDGQVFYERAKDLLSDFDEIKNLFRNQHDETLTGRLRVDMPLALARDVVIPHLPEFVAQHPALEIELNCTDQRVDLIRDGYDCVIRAGELSDSSLICRAIGHYRMISVASSGYLARYGVPQSLADLDNHELVHYAAWPGTRTTGLEYIDPQSPEQVRYKPMTATLTVNNSTGYLSACLAGFGIIQVPESGIQSYLSAGILQEILPAYRPPTMPLNLIYANRRHLPRRVKVFMDWLVEKVKSRVIGHEVMF